MKVKTKVLLILSVVIALSIGTIVTINSQTQMNQSQDKSVANKLDDDATPIVDFNDNNRNLNIEQDQILKNSRYDNSSFVLSDPPLNAGEVIRYDEGSSIPDIPIEKSNIIVEGQVNDSKAFLSNDKSGIYSEFTVVISKVLKNNYDNLIKPNETIIAERFGGRVRYPSGKTIRYKIAGQGSPSVNSKYLFFLAETQGNNYKILTAYELKDNKVFALDGVRTFTRRSRNSVFDSHNGQEYQNFINEVNQAIEYKGGK